MIHIDYDNQIDQLTIEKALDFTLPEHYKILSYTQVVNNEIKGKAIIALQNYFDIDIELSVFAFGRWASRSMFKHLFSYVYDHLKCERCTVKVHKDNRKSIKLVEGLGFVKEGYLRVYDASIYSLLKNECKFYGINKTQKT